MKRTLRSLLAGMLLCFSPLAWSQHTVNNETNNNTTGCFSPTATYVGATSCQANFPGARDDNSSAGPDSNNAPNNPTPNQVVDTVTFAAVPKNVADFAGDGVDIHNLVYPGYTGPIFANIVLWHDGPGTNGNGFNYTPKQPNPPGENTLNNHYMTGYISDSVNQIAAQLAYMQRLKINGIVANPPGPLPPAMSSQSTTNKNVNDAVEQWKTKAGGTASFLYSVMTDKVMWEQNGSTACGNAGKNVTPNCVERIMICSLDYMNTPTTNTFGCALDATTYNGGGYFGDSHYWKVNSRPVVSYFLDASAYFNACTPSQACPLYNDNQSGLTCTSSNDCWTKIWGSSTQGIQHHISSFTVKPYIIHRNTSGPSAPAPNDGTFRWFNPSQDQTYLNFGPASVDSSGYDGWLTSVFNSPPAVYLAVGYGKVDHAQSPFEVGDHLIMDARCGQTFLDSMGRPAAKGFGTAHPLQALEIATWDDYDEGTEMETGIDICVNALTASINGSTLNWSITFNNAQFGNEDKIDHYTIYYTNDGSTNTSIDHSLVVLANVAVNHTGSYSYLLPNTLPNPTIIYVKAVAKPMLQNRLAGGVVFIPPQTHATGAMSITGSVYFDFNCSCYDSGSVTVTINNFTVTLAYDGLGLNGAPDAQHLAQDFAASFNAANSPVTAQAVAGGGGWQVQFTSKATGPGANYSVTSNLSSAMFGNSTGGQTFFVVPPNGNCAAGSENCSGGLTGGH